MKRGPGYREDPHGVEIRTTKPRGWCWLTSEPVRETEKAIQVEYYRHLLWLPKAVVLRVDDVLCVDRKFISAAQDHPSYELA